jgi:hypothetical protein
MNISTPLGLNSIDNISAFFLELLTQETKNETLL